MSQRVTAAAEGRTLTLYGGVVTAAAVTRTLIGDVVRYGVVGRTSAGPLRVRPDALRWPEDLTRVKLTREHNRDESRGYMTELIPQADRVRVAMKVSDGPEGDDALREAADRTRDGFSFDVVDAQIEGDELVDALVIAIGQVGIPAYDDSRIDTIAASQTPAASAAGTSTGGSMTEEERQELATLRGLETRTAEQEARLAELEQKAREAGEEQASAGTEQQQEQAPAGQQVAASFGNVMPGVPAGQGGGQGGRRDNRSALQRLIDVVVDGYDRRTPQVITAALNDVTVAQHGGIVAEPAWSGELWSGDDEDFGEDFAALLSSGTLTALEGKGWRFKTKPEIKDYAGNKTAIPTTTIETEPSTWTAARMAVGNDFDRAFYDFPALFKPLLEGYVRFVKLSWRMKMSEKSLAYILANAVPAAGVAAQPTVLKAAAQAIKVLKDRRVGKADWILMNDDDHFTLFDLSKDEVPAFLDLFDLDPGSIKSSPDVPQGTVLAGVRKVAELKTLPGSPIRVDAQHLANGGIDEAFFGYYAFEEHHPAGIASVEFEPPAEV